MQKQFSISARPFILGYDHNTDRSKSQRL